jgi:hypothetical protein
MNALQRYPVKHPPLSRARSRTGKFRGAWLLSKSRTAWGRDENGDGRGGDGAAKTVTSTAASSRCGRGHGCLAREDADEEAPRSPGRQISTTGGEESSPHRSSATRRHGGRRIASSRQHSRCARTPGAPELQACQHSRGRIGSSCRSRPPLVQEPCDAGMLREGGDRQREETEMRALSRRSTGMSKLTPREADAREWEGDHVRAGDDTRTTSSPACPRRPELLLGRSTPATSPAHRRPTPPASPPPPWPG